MIHAPHIRIDAVALFLPANVKIPQDAESRQFPLHHVRNAIFENCPWERNRDQYCSPSTQGFPIAQQDKYNEHNRHNPRKLKCAPTQQLRSDLSQAYTSKETEIIHLNEKRYSNSNPL